MSSVSTRDARDTAFGSRKGYRGEVPAYLSYGKRPFINVAGFARGPQLPTGASVRVRRKSYSHDPSAPIASIKRLRREYASTHQATRGLDAHVGDFRKLRIMAVTVHDRLLEVRVERRSDGGEEAVPRTMP